MNNVRELSLDEDLSFEAFCDQRFINQVPEDELKEFAKLHYVQTNNAYNDIEVSQDVFRRGSRFEVDKKHMNKDIYAYCIYDDVSRNNQWELPSVHIGHSLCYKVRDYELIGQECDPYTSINYNYITHKHYTFSDFTMYKPKYFFNSWEFDPAFFMFMYKKFGDKYVDAYLEKRNMYRAYWLSKETAKRDEAIRLMEENVPVFEVPKLTKTTDTFIESTPIEMAKLFHMVQVSGEPWVIDVTNFQTLKNEDIPEDKKRYGNNTRLRRIKYQKKDGNLESFEEYQWREQKYKYDWENKKSIPYYPKKNPPVKSKKFQFRDFDYTINEGDLPTKLTPDDTTHKWTGLMYAAFGENYRQAYTKTFDDKITEFTNQFDAETIKIINFICNNLNNNSRLSTPSSEGM